MMESRPPHFAFAVMADEVLSAVGKATVADVEAAIIAEEIDYGLLESVLGEQWMDEFQTALLGDGRSNPALDPLGGL